MAVENDIALIENYLQGELGAEGKKEVEDRLLNDTDFKSLFDDTSIMLEGLGKIRHKKLLSRLDELESGLGNPLESKRAVKTVYWTVQKIAATFIGVVLLATASWYVITGSYMADGNALYGEYFTAYENVMVPTTRSNEDLTPLVKTFRAYDEQAFDSAALLFDQLLETDQREFVRFYGAIAYMEAGETEKTTELLKTIISKKGEFQVQATWYLALNFIQQEQYDNAKSLLESLKDSSAYKERAQQLLKKMR